MKFRILLAFYMSSSFRDERSVKLEKLGEMERQVEAERLRVEWEKEVQAHEVRSIS